MTDFQVGATYSSFVLKRMEFIPEVDSTAFLFSHSKLGTEAFAIKNNDPNKTFCITFQTIPEDSTGVAHILEHSVLMGSKKYPVKDVFGEINKGGLMTFLNAMTGSDTTWYPFATRNLTEYFNIMDVYCDVSLNPQLLQSTFEQEGWHYHKEETDQPLQFQGVVFNEMKGAFSDPIRSLFHHIFKGLMPESTYSHESGGDPKNIPDLSYKQFTDFHRRYYHPTNATLFFYGDADLGEELEFVQDHFLSLFDQPGQIAAIKQGKNITSPVLIEDTYGIQPGSDLSGKTFLAVGSAVGNILDKQRNTAFLIIAQILYNSDASPLKIAILQAGLCKDFGGLFLSSSCFTTIMMTYLVGSEKDNLSRFREVYTNTLNDIVESGLDHDLVLSELNKYEFSVREELTKAQRGLDLIGKVLPALKHGTDPFDELCIEKLFKDIRTKALEERYFEELIREFLLNNPSTVEVVLQPDKNKLLQAQEDEQKRLNTFESSLNKDEQSQVVLRTKELTNLQVIPNDEETLKLLPQLSLGDLNATLTYHQVEPDTIHGIPFLVNRLPTNSIAYIDFGFDCTVIPSDLLCWLNLFGTIVTEIGTSKKDYIQFARELGINTGGFTHSFSTYNQLGTLSDSCRPVLWFHLKSLSSNLEPALALVGEIFGDVSFDNRQRIKEIVRREFAWSEHSVQSEGYSLASSRVFAHLSSSGMYNEYVNGASAYLELKNLVHNYDTLEDQFLHSLRKLHQILLCSSGMTLSITGQDDDIVSFRHGCSVVFDNLADSSVPTVEPQFQPFDTHQGLCTSAEVVYNVQGCALFPNPDDYNGHFEVLKTWISRDYLWNTVRQMGGAYGCFVQFNHLTGNFGLVSYRDPQITKTFSAYDNLQDAVDQLNLSKQVIDQLIIGTYGSLDPHQTPAAKGATAKNEYLSGITAEFKQIRIDQVLSASEQSMKQFAPYFDNLVHKSYRATIGNGDKIRSHSDLYSSIIEL